METLRLKKFQGFGNDFLVAILEPAELSALDSRGMDWPALARSACDRHFGVGADGLLIGVASSQFQSGNHARMLLHNADGSLAATSGNGIACLMHALARSTPAWRDLVDKGVELNFEAIIETGVDRFSAFAECHAEQREDESIGYWYAGATVEMPSVGEGPGVSRALAQVISDDFDGARFATGDVGNPHLVVSTGRPVTADETASFGERYERHFVGGINIEFVWQPERAGATGGDPSELAMAVWERGAGVTLACGSGAVVAATRAIEWELVPDRGFVHVAMPGGLTTVTTEPITPNPFLRVLTNFIADIEWPLRGPWLDA